MKSKSLALSAKGLGLCLSFGLVLISLLASCQVQDTVGQGGAITNSLSAGKVELDSIEARTLPIELREIVEKGELVIAMGKLDSFPWHYTNAKGEFVGIDVELAEDIASALSVKAVFDRASDEPEYLAALVNTGRADMLISGALTAGPITAGMVVGNLRLSSPYADLRIGMMISRLDLARAIGRDSGFPVVTGGRASAELLSSLSSGIACVLGPWSDSAQKTFLGTKIDTRSRQNDCFAALLDKRVSAWFTDELSIANAMAARPDSLVALKTVYFADSQCGAMVGTTWAKAQLGSWIEAFLAAREKAGKRLDCQSILELYGYSSSFEQSSQIKKEAVR